MHAKTHLVYLEHMDKMTCDATVIDVLQEDSRTVVILDKTVFHPQGGGQPYDKGFILGMAANLK